MQGIHVFFATDGSASSRFAQSQILALPWRPPVHVTVMTALEAFEPPLASWGPGRQRLDAILKQIRRDSEAHAQEVLDKARQALEGKVASVATRVHEGEPGPRLVEMAKACRADLVMAGSRGLGEYKGFLLGSVSDYLANYASCSVMLVKTPPQGRRRFLVALDDSSHAAAVVRWMGRLDLSGEAWIHLLKVFRSDRDFPYSTEEGDLPYAGGGVLPEKFTAWSDSPEMLKALYEQDLEANGARVTVEVRFGQATTEILASARAFEPDLLVVGAKGRHSPWKWPLGSTAQHLVDHAPCSILVVRPEGRDPLQSSFR